MDQIKIYIRKKIIKELTLELSFKHAKILTGDLVLNTVRGKRFGSFVKSRSIIWWIYS